MIVFLVKNLSDTLDYADSIAMLADTFSRFLKVYSGKYSEETNSPVGCRHSSVFAFHVNIE